MGLGLESDSFPWVFFLTMIGCLVAMFVSVSTNEKGEPGKHQPKKNISYIISFLFGWLAIVFGMMIGLVWVFKAVWAAMPA